jgi:hypothetical protein
MTEGNACWTRAAKRLRRQGFFLEDGTPKYYHDRTYPIDIHAPAQAVCFFSREGKEYKDLTDRIVTWMLKNMYSRRGFFYFRRGWFLTNRIPCMRWSQAWAFHALTEYLFAAERDKPVMVPAIQTQVS